MYVHEYSCYLFTYCRRIRITYTQTISLSVSLLCTILHYSVPAHKLNYSEIQIADRATKNGGKRRHPVFDAGVQNPVGRIPELQRGRHAWQLHQRTLLWTLPERRPSIPRQRRYDSGGLPRSHAFRGDRGLRRFHRHHLSQLRIFQVVSRRTRENLWVPSAYTSRVLPSRSVGRSATNRSLRKPLSKSPEKVWRGNGGEVEERYGKSRWNLRLGFPNSVTSSLSKSDLASSPLSFCSISSNSGAKRIHFFTKFYQKIRTGRSKIWIVKNKHTC